MRDWEAGEAADDNGEGACCCSVVSAGGVGSRACAGERTENTEEENEE